MLPSLSTLNICAPKRERTDDAGPSTKFPLKDLPDDLLGHVIKNLMNVLASDDPCARLSERCATSREFAQICSSDDFWKLACEARGYDREDRTTGFHRMRLDVPMPWREQFKKWCGLRFKTKEDLKSKVRYLLREDATGAAPIRKYGPVGSWDVSLIDDMSNLFQMASDFNQHLDWDTSNVVDMSYMFNYAKSFDKPIGSWNTSKLENASFMFADAENFNQPLSDWDVSNVVVMGGMFQDATAFDKPLDWDVKNVKNMSAMFVRAKSFDQPLSGWTVSNVINMAFMFYEAESFNQPLDGWDVSGVVTMRHMFEGATSFNQSLEDWKVSDQVDTTEMFKDAVSLRVLPSWITSPLTK